MSSNPNIIQEFHISESSAPHAARAGKMLKEYPQVKTLFGKNLMTFPITVGLVAAQVVLAYFLADASWIAILLASYLIGAFISHALFVMIHECSHQLIFKSHTANRLLGLVANFPHLLPSYISFEKYHLKHHAFQGIYDLDSDLPSRWEAKLIDSNFFMKCLWLLLFPIFQAIRIFRIRSTRAFDAWTIVNFATQIAFGFAIVYFLSWKALAYMALSFSFSVGLHPLGARWVQEHYLTEDDEQETYSYYGVLNKLSFNVGYHNEHHDFPAIPWNKLPDLKSMAPEYYDHLKSHQSWFKLFINFLTNNKISLFSRIIRTDK
ncbi:MAG: fatty acid desaturase [Saprospiraceae bacterium]|nr:fatty acid desaturase [Saprospiraceae bacterium]